MMNDSVKSILTHSTADAWREVGRSRPHESAVLHVLGEATYTDDIPEVQATLHAALPLPPADS